MSDKIYYVKFSVSLGQVPYAERARRTIALDTGVFEIDRHAV